MSLNNEPVAPKESNPLQDFTQAQRFIFLRAMNEELGELPGFRNLTDALGNVMLAKMLEFAVQQGKQQPLYDALENDPKVANQWREQLLNTDEAKQVLNDGIEGYGRVIGYSGHMQKMMMKALTSFFETVLCSGGVYMIE